MNNKNPLKWYVVKCCDDVIVYRKNKNDDSLKTSKNIKNVLTRHLKKHNLTILEYYDKYYNKLEKCNFCGNNYARYSFSLNIDDKRNLCFNDMELYAGYMCENKECSRKRNLLNPNSDIKISKQFGLTLDEAKKYRIEHNKSPFYFHPGIDSKDEYNKRQSRSLEWYIKKYGDIEGRKRSKIHFDKISHANKKTTLTKKYGEERANKIANDKKQTLENFIKRYGEIEGKERYTKWITTCTISGKYIEGRYTLSSRCSYDFFVKLSDMLIKNNLVKDTDIIYANGVNCEYQIQYFNNENKLRWYFLDYVILSKKINIEFNGSQYHANPILSEEEKNKWQSLFLNKTFNEITDKDDKRDEIIKQHGFTILKVWDTDINSVEKFDATLNKIFNNIKDLLIKNENII